ncbi:urease accessory UreF family protein [Streptomyces ipomoeae]|uniref:urease accessory protein UreF n=1 Tax=Streptomyces ipomoeae TaxID=103232 RepID=UPI0011469633|nr:urease accessory UreF family protein [Streptomyces ipomoeae]MDX2696003.1 urease accessory UreF family protein [Streptomyces ipomoeae]MDX2823694.1 urease accessory UreF family protein [Streptomyces ipomoeae]MDX2841779.1 urease accessory UreF family protein [Streptomyces ipomoeae]MDX2877683.1 urease accessory UreF family protein [Streptomyces ipomoeae]TQE20541.1 urease accessory protein UreF [Streptomyces ipomoeae]
MSRAALLILADGRFPAGGHAHSGGAEAAVKAGRIRGVDGLEAFCRGRLHTAGLVSAALAAAAALGVDPVELDAAADARTPSLALRGASRKLGRQLMRAAWATWPSDELDAVAREFPKGAHQPVVLGVTARAAGLGADDVAYCAAYEGISGPAGAVVRLLSLDPFEATGVLARLAPEVDRVVGAAVEAAREAVVDGVDALPAASAPLLEVGAEVHAGWPVRLFAS